MRLAHVKCMAYLSLAICAASCVLWVRGRHVTEEMSWLAQPGGYGGSVGTSSGGFDVTRFYRSPGGLSEDRWEFRYRRVPRGDVEWFLTEEDNQSQLVEVRLPGVRYQDVQREMDTSKELVAELSLGPLLVVRRRPLASGGTDSSAGYSLVVAWRTVVVTTGVLPAVAMILFFRRRRRRSARVHLGLCDPCGYDLRGLVADPGPSAIRCPECGATGERPAGLGPLRPGHP